MNFYDCKGGPGTTEPACGACVTCLHRVIESKDAEVTALRERIKRLEEAGNELEAFCSAEGALRKWTKAKETKP